MAVSQIFGSNVFVILIGLGLPWIIKTVGSNSEIKLENFGLLVSCLLIFMTLLMVLVGLYFFGFKLNKKYGILLTIAYLLFLIGSVSIEIYFLHKYHLPICRSF